MTAAGPDEVNCWFCEGKGEVPVSTEPIYVLTTSQIHPWIYSQAWVKGTLAKIQHPRHGTFYAKQRGSCWHRIERKLPFGYGL